MPESLHSDHKRLNMRFLFVANTRPDPYLGASGCDLATIGALRGLGHEVDEIWLGQVPQRIAHPNLHQLLELPRRYARAVAEKCQSQAYDVIQVNQPHAFLAAREHRRLRRPGLFLNRSHGWEPLARLAMGEFQLPKSDRRPLWRRAASWMMAGFLERHNDLVLRYSDGIIVCSIDHRDYILKDCPHLAHRVLALAPGIANEYLSELPSQDKDRFHRLLYVGSFNPLKAPEVVAQVLIRVLEKRDDMSATWVAEGDSHSAIKQLLGPTASQRVTLSDWMPRQDLRRIYDEHGILLFPSHHEGFSLTFLEAMTRGLCVLGTSIDGMRQLIKSGTNGFLFERRAVDAMVATTLQLASNPAACVRISQQARQTVQGFTWERTAREYVAFCEDLARAKRP